MQVEGIIFHIKLKNCKKLIPGIKTSKQVELCFIIMRNCLGILFQVFTVSRDNCLKRNVFVLVLNQYSTLPDVPKMFPHFNNICEVANVVETECVNEICMGPFTVTFNPERKMELFCGPSFWCQEIFSCDKKYSCTQSIGSKGLTFSSKIEGSIEICKSKTFKFKGKRFSSYLEVSKPMRFCNKKIDMSSSSSSECDDEFETPLVGAPLPVAPLFTSTAVAEPSASSQMEEEEDEQSDDEEEYFYIKKAQCVKNRFNNPFMPNWKLNDDKHVIDKMLEKKSRRNTDVQTARNTSANVKTTLPSSEQRRRTRQNPLEPNPSLAAEGNVEVVAPS